jgi:hypothetical protein
MVEKKKRAKDGAARRVCDLSSKRATNPALCRIKRATKQES